MSRPSAVAQEAQRVGEQQELDALFLGVVDFRRAGGQLVMGAPVDDIGMLGAQAQGGAGPVHGDVAAAEGGDILAFDDGRVTFGEGIGLHQVGAGQVFVGRIDADEMFAGDLQEDRQPGADAQEDGVEALLQEFIHGFASGR